MANEHREKGIEMFNEVYCNDLPQPPETGKDRFFDYGPTRRSASATAACCCSAR